MMNEGRTDTLFLQRLSELSERCTARYCPEFTHFLDGRELRVAREYLARYDVRVVSYGGFSDAERRVVGVFPQDVYSEDITPDEELYDMFELSAVEITGSGFSKFSHRDVMGSVLGLGVKREAIGDIYVTDDNMHAYICMTKIAARYVSDSLEFVARDKVKIKIIEPCDLPCPERKFQVISGTVAAERLDCIIALATNLSREKSKQLISGGFVSVNHVEQLRCDVSVCEDDILSVRGYGRFILSELGGVTRKGRNRVVVHKMI